MFKRVIWFGSGLASGVVGSWWAKRKVKREVQKQAEKYTTVAGLAGEAKRRFAEVTGQQPDQASRPQTRGGNRAASTAQRANNKTNLDGPDNPADNVVPIRPAAGPVQAAASTMARWRGQARDRWMSRSS